MENENKKKYFVKNGKYVLKLFLRDNFHIAV